MRRRVISTRFDGWVDPAACFLAFCEGSEPAFWLDSGEGSSSGMSCMGLGSRVVTQRGGTLCEWPSSESREESILTFLRREQSPGVRSDGEALPFPLGWVGWLGYELHEQTLQTGTRRLSRYPDAAFLFAERSVVFDHSAHTVTLVALGESWSGEAELWRRQTFGTLTELSAAGSADDVQACAIEPSDHSTGSVEWAYSDHEYLSMIGECQDSIRAGDAYQLCLTTEIRCDIRPDPIATYLRLRKLSPSHHGGFLRVETVSLLSSSPETFLTVSADGVVESKPIKGTRKRGSTVEEDVALRDELLASDKERSENLMIVDLVRNDLSRVCELGSVVVPKLLDVESYAQVHQLVSTVRGMLAADRDAVDAVMSCFPAGSMTGAPKLSAVGLVDALERRPRGIYSGAWGYFGLDGSVDLAMTIRSIVIDAQGSTIGTGGGITALSVPSDELEETRIKASALLQALGLVTL